MPDLTPVLTHTCSSNIFWALPFTGDSGVEYTISYAKGEWHCTCPGFKYHGDCKHLRDDKLTSQRCGWAEDAFANTTYHERACPECGEETTPFYFGAELLKFRVLRFFDWPYSRPGISLQTRDSGMS